MKNRCYGKFNRGHSSLQDKFRKGLSKLLFQKTLMLRELIMQGRHEIARTLDNSGTNIHSISHKD